MNYKQSALFVFLSFACAALLLGHIERMFETELLSPLSAKEYVTIEKEVEKIVYLEPSSVEEKIQQVFGKDAKTAIKIAKCESGLNPKAVNKTSSARGLFQIMQSWHKIDQKWLFNEDINIEVAHQLFLEQGFGPWKASEHCWK
jgi:hypothetical protein